MRTLGHQHQPHPKSPMKSKRSRTTIWLTLPLAAGLALTSFAAIQDQGEPITPTAAEPGQSAEDLNHEMFEKNMKGLMRGQKALRKLIADPTANQAAIMTTLETMEKNAVAVYSLTPPKPEEELSEPEWALYRITYKAQIVEMQATLLRLQMAALRTDEEALQDGYKALQAHKKEGHDQFKFD